MRSRPLALAAPMALAGLLTIGGCGQGDDPAPDGAVAPATAAPAPDETAPGTEPAPAEETPPRPSAQEPTATGTGHRVTFDWAAPSEQVTISHPAVAPTAYLVAIYVGDHPEEEPPYQRMAFYFREGYPEYNLQYVRSVTGEGTGEAISLDGNAFLRVGFVNAQAHDDAGASTISTAPAATIGFHNLKSYGSAGDFEGHLTYGLGLQVAPDSDQVLLVRAGELERPDGAGGTYYVVYVDVETG